jgi:hypothetical protein
MRPSFNFFISIGCVSTVCMKLGLALNSCVTCRILPGTRDELEVLGSNESRALENYNLLVPKICLTKNKKNPPKNIEKNMLMYTTLIVIIIKIKR